MSAETMRIDCWLCGSEFEQTHKYQIYCCPACEDKAARTWEEYNAPKSSKPVQLGLFDENHT